MGAKELTVMVDIDKVLPSKFNPRKTFEKVGMKELEDSIKKHGILQPILVRGAETKKGEVFFSTYEIICGERRHRAAVAAGLKQIPVRVVEMDDASVLEVQVIENLQRADLHPLEEAEGYESLIDKHGYTNAEDIAAKVGKSTGYVYGRMKLCNLIPECRKMFYREELTPATAILIARMPKDVQLEAAKAITEEQWNGKMSTEQARRHIQNNYMLNLKDAKFAKNDKICPERGSCTTCLKRTKNDTLLFDDIGKEDKCTDAECFNAKKQAVVDIAIEKAKKTGHTVVDSEKAFQYGSQLSGGFKALDSICYKDGKNRTYKELMKNSDIKPLLAVDGEGRVHEVINPKDIDNSLKKLGVLAEKEKSTPVDEEMVKVREAVHFKAVADLSECIRKDKEQNFWTLIADLLLSRATTETKKIIVRRMDPTVKPVDANKYLEDHVKGIEASDLPQFVLELLVSPEYQGFYMHSEGLVTALEFYRMDIKKLEKEATAKIKKQKKEVSK